MDDAVRDEIARRLQSLDDERDKVLSRLDDINRERGRLEIALTTYDSVKSSMDEGAPPPLKSGFIPPATKGKKKPDGIPTIAEMVQTVLAHAQKEEGVGALESQEIVQRIRARWWPDAGSNDIAPLLWRMAKQDKLSKRGTKYSLPVNILTIWEDAQNERDAS